MDGAIDVGFFLPITGGRHRIIARTVIVSPLGRVIRKPGAPLVCKVSIDADEEDRLATLFESFRACPDGGVVNVTFNSDSVCARMNSAVVGNDHTLRGIFIVEA